MSEPYHAKPKNSKKGYNPYLDSVIEHIEEIAYESGIEMPCYSKEYTENYHGHVLQFFYDENSYLNGFKCFVTGFGTYSGCSFECAKKSAVNAMEAFNSDCDL
jgi:hypothetical protein